MKIIDAKTEHISEILAIEYSSFSAPWSEKFFSEVLLSEKITLKVAVDENETVLGFICFMIIDSEAELLNIAVSTKSRKNGIGSILLEYMISILSDKKAEIIFLEVRESNIPARYLYEKFGFDIIGRRKNYYTHPTEDAILMKKNLNS